jgi:exodeoxyribonuclease VII small subunit
MNDGDGLDRDSFNKNYAILKEAADWLSKQGEPDIDALVPKVEKAMGAYAICKDRLLKVQEALGQYLEPDDAAEENPPSVANGASRIRTHRFSADGEAHSDDHPF